MSRTRNGLEPNRSITSAGIAGASCLRSFVTPIAPDDCRSIEIEIACRLRDGFPFGLPKRLFETARQGIATRALRGNGLLEQRLTPRSLFRDQPVRVAQFRTIAANGLFVPHDAPQVRVDDKRC